MQKRKHRILSMVLIVAMTAGMVDGLGGCGKKNGDELTITNVSYDPTREFYEKYNVLFEQYYEKNFGKKVRVIQSHGGSGSQARSVVEGCNADVVTLALEHDITLIEKTGLIDAGWQKEFDKDSAPYTSTIVFLVRKENPKQIHDWQDLVKNGVEVITPDPKSSGGACWNFLAALSYAKTTWNDAAKEKQFMKALYQNVSVMDSGARGATTTFVENKKGDVLIAWENEAFLSVRDNPDDYEIVTPSISILAQPSVAVVDENVKKHDNEAAAQAYLKYLYSDEAQELIAENYYRPVKQKILKKHADTFNLKVKLTTIKDFGGWDEVQKKHFADGGVFDEIYEE